MEQTWYVYTIIVAYILFYIVTKFTKNMTHSTYVLLLLSIIYIFLARCVLDIDWKWWASILGINTGMFIQLYEDKLKALISRFRILITLLIPFGLFCIYAAGHFRISEYAVSIGFPLITITLIYLCGICQNKVLTWIGNYSYEIYLVHFTLFPFYYHWPLHAHIGNMTYSIFYIVAITFLAMLVQRVTLKLHSLWQTQIISK